MNDFFQKLASAPVPRGSSESIQLLGKQAAGLFIRKESPNLNQAVTQIVSQNPELSRDQIERVTQAANQSAWNELFHRGGENTTFEPASSEQILSGLNTGPAELVAPRLDYLQDPPKPDLAMSQSDLMEAFGVKPDVSEVVYAPLNPQVDSEREKNKTAAAVDVFRHTVDRLVPLFQSEYTTFYNHVKQAHLQHGHGIAQIARVIGQVADSKSFASDIMSKVASQLRAEGAITTTHAQELSKLAEAVVVDSSHPLLSSYAALEELGRGYAESSVALEKVSKKMRMVKSPKGKKSGAC